mgnify:CR=1 FL=1
MTINGKGAPGIVYLLAQVMAGCSVTHLKKKGGAPKVRKVFNWAMRLPVPLKG